MIITIILIPLLFFEFILLHLFGLRYESTSALFVFLLIYLFTEGLLSFLLTSVLKALKVVGMIKSSKSGLSFVLHISLTFLLIGLIDLLLQAVSITWYGALLFSIIISTVRYIVSEQDDGPTSRDLEKLKRV